MMRAMRLSCFLLAAGLALAACNRPLAQRLATPEELPTVAAPTALTPLVSATPVSGSVTAGTGQSGTFEIESGGVQRTFLLYQPSTYQKGTAVPLVLNFHGLTSDGPGEQALSGMTPKAEAEGFIVVYPNGIDHAWRDGPASADVVFARDLISQLQKTYTIDPKRIYVTGMSNGGGMTNRLACDLADVVAAAGPVAGAYNGWRICNPAHPMPLIAFHGLNDNVVPYGGAPQGLNEPPIHDWAQAWADRNGCGATPTVSQPDPTVKEEAWGGCTQNADVVLYTLDNHGHSWPGSALLPGITSQAINATDLMWAFFVAHPLP